MSLEDFGDSDAVFYRYKYLPFNSGSLKMISEGTVKFTSPSDFNDPFDCLPKFEIESLESLEKIRPEFVGLSAVRKAQMISNIKRALDSGEYVSDLHSRVGVLSLSRNPLSVLMWSHYADHHRGFVVELCMRASAPDDLLDFIMPFEVTYAKERPAVPWGARFDLEKYFLTKSDQWAYEEEERVMSPEGCGPGIYKYSREHFLSSVIAGSRIREHDFQLLYHVVHGASRNVGRSIPIYRAKVSRSKFSILIPSHPNPAFHSD